MCGPGKEVLWLLLPGPIIRLYFSSKTQSGSWDQCSAGNQTILKLPPRRKWLTFLTIIQRRPLFQRRFQIMKIFNTSRLLSRLYSSVFFFLSFSLSFLGFLIFWWMGAYVRSQPQTGVCVCTLQLCTSGYAWLDQIMQCIKSWLGQW